MHPAPPLLLDASRGEDDSSVGLSDLEILARELGLQGNASLDDVKRGIWDLRRRNGVDCEASLVDESGVAQEI
jgi:hypothetical protein